MIKAVDWLIGHREEWPFTLEPSTQQEAYLEFAASLVETLYKDHAGQVPTLVQQRFNQHFTLIDGVVHYKASR